MKTFNYYAGRYEATGAVVTVTRSSRTRLLDPRYDIRNQSPTGFTWGYAGSGPAQLALAILADYFGDKPGGKALADALYQPFKFAVIVALPQECAWKMSFEEVGIILCRLLTDKQDLFSRTISSLESAVYEEMFSRQGEEDEPFAANFSEATISERLAAMLSEAFPMSPAFAGSLVEQYYAGLNAQQHT
ncbi:MAG TPA: DUF6166 domain-containing protein [Terrimicrobiaceae bacterium]